MHDDITKAPEDGAYIWGMYMQVKSRLVRSFLPIAHDCTHDCTPDCTHLLMNYLQGARFDPKILKMAESKPKELFDPVPVIL